VRGGSHRKRMGHLSEFFFTLRGSNGTITHLFYNYLLSNYFRLNTLKGNTKAPTVDLMRLNKRYDKHTHETIIGITHSNYFCISDNLEIIPNLFLH